MTLDQIRYFCVAAQLGSFSKAAQTVHISQPSLCIAIKKLEQELDVHLFQENRKSAMLTEAGRLFLQDTQNILRQVDIAVTHMKQFSQKDRAEIRIAYTATMADNYIPRLLKEFLAEEGKGCCIYSDEMPTDQIAQGIREGRFDFGIGSQMPPDSELEQIPIMYQRLCLLLPAEEPDLSVYQSVHALENKPFICYRKDYPMYRLLDGLFAEWKIRPHMTHYVYSEKAIAHLVEQNLGIAIVADVEGLESFRVQKLYPAWLTGGRYLYLIRHRTHMTTQAAQQLQERVLKNSEKFKRITINE